MWKLLLTYHAGCNIGTMPHDGHIFPEGSNLKGWSWPLSIAMDSLCWCSLSPLCPIYCAVCMCVMSCLFYWLVTLVGTYHLQAC